MLPFFTASISGLEIFTFFANFGLNSSNTSAMTLPFLKQKNKNILVWWCLHECLVREELVSEEILKGLQIFKMASEMDMKIIV